VVYLCKFLQKTNNEVHPVFCKNGTLQLVELIH